MVKKRLYRSKSVAVGLFTLITLLLAIPLVMLMVQENQDPRQFADEGVANAEQKILLSPTP